MTTYTVTRDDDQTLTLCDRCERGYPLAEMAAIPQGSGLTHWYTYRCKECQGKGEDDE